MSILLYAISRDDALAPAADRLHEVCAGGLRALVEPVQQPLRADLEQLVRYEETVEVVMQRHTILPMRFGSVVGDESEVRDLLRSHAREFHSALARLDGTVEFGVQASATPHDATDPDGGAGLGESYMRARVAEHRCRRELQAWLEDELEPFVREGVYRTTPITGPYSISAAYLVDREHAAELQRRLAELADGADRQLSWSGPWPPYTFVDGLAA
jgi:hypothetical protein